MSLSPQDIHPALWRGSQLGSFPGSLPGSRTDAAIPTGHAGLDAALPGGGWPTGALIEVLNGHPGIGEIRLLQPALAGVCQTQAVVLLHPPYLPNITCWAGWNLPVQQLLCINTGRVQDAWWAAEQILKSGSCAALLCWLDPIRTPELRRLHVAAQSGRTLFFLFRPLAARQQPSPAPLRLALAPAGQGEQRAHGLKVSIFKRRGPACAHSIEVALPDDGLPLTPDHAPLDRLAPAQPQPRHLATTLAH